MIVYKIYYDVALKIVSIKKYFWLEILAILLVDQSEQDGRLPAVHW